MGGSQSKVTETEIRNELNMEIKNRTENITKIINQTINKVTNNMVLETTTEVIQTNAGSAIFEARDIKQRGGSIIKIDQNVDVKSINSAVLKIVQSNEALTKLATKFQEEILNKIKNDNDMKGELEAINKIKQLEKDAGGPESLVRQITNTANDMIKSMTGTSTKEEVKTKIINKLNLRFENQTINQNEINKKVENIIKNNMSNISKQTCKFETKGDAIIRVGNIDQDEKGNMTVGQSVSVNALNKCIIDTLNTNSIVNDISTTGLTSSSSNTENANKSQGSMKTDNSVVQEKINESVFDFFKDFKDIIIYAGLAIAGILILYIVIKLIPSSGNNEMGYMNPQMGYMNPQMGYMNPQMAYGNPQMGYMSPRRGYREEEDGEYDQRGGFPLLENKLLHPLLILITIIFWVFRK